MVALDMQRMHSLIEEQSMARGLACVEVLFCQNVSARVLYRSLGYNVTGFNMVKPLCREGAQAPTCSVMWVGSVNFNVRL